MVGMVGVLVLVIPPFLPIKEEEKEVWEFGEADWDWDDPCHSK